MYRKSIHAKRLEAKRKRCAAMRLAKARKRMEFGSTMNDARFGWRAESGRTSKAKRNSAGGEGNEDMDSILSVEYNPNRACANLRQRKPFKS